MKISLSSFIIFLAFFGASSANKIIGGSSAVSGQFPSIVYQTKSGIFFCGGTIVSPDTILSAAHCEESLYSLSVTAGATSRDDRGVTKNVIFKEVHPNFNSKTAENDIMVLQVATPFTFGQTINAASLPVPLQTPSAGTEITIAGWGDTNPGFIQSLATELQYANVEVISTEACNSETSYSGQVLPGMICIGNMEGGEDSCQGDSGGPAYLTDSPIVVGITSWGSGCAQPNTPGVYTDVSQYVSWIQQYLTPDQ